MTTAFKAKLEAAIDKVLNDAADDGNEWEHFIHPELIRQMTDAAEAVFDSAQDAQKYYIENSD